MSKKFNAESSLTLGDKIAITVGCLGGAMVIVTYLIPNKTRFFTGMLIVFLWIFCCYPPLHFVRRPKTKMFCFIVVSLLVILFGKKVWPPPNRPTADIRVEDAVIENPVVDEKPALNFYFYNDSPATLTVTNYNLINVDTRGVKSQDDENRIEDEEWEMLRKYVGENSPGPGDNYPAKVRTWKSIIDPNHKLTSDEVNALKNNTGAVTIRFLSVFQYQDDSGVHELDQCVLSQNTFTSVLCKKTQ